MKIKDIINTIEEFAPLSIQESWDNSGLCIGSPEDEVSSVLLGLDCTSALVDEAIACGADMIVTHHPLIFSGIRHMDGRDGTSRKVIFLLQNNIAAMSFHTRLDAADGGINDILANLFRLSDVEKFGEALKSLYFDEVIPMIDRGLCATVYTQVSDVEDEINGLYTYDRQVCKVDKPGMREILRGAEEKLREAVE